MKEMVCEVLAERCEKVSEGWSCLDTSTLGSELVGYICLLSAADEDLAVEKLAELEVTFEKGWDIISLSHFLISAKELGYNERDMESYISLLEKQRSAGLWSKQIWLNSLVLKALGMYGISYPNITDYLLEKRCSKGSWFQKNWVTSFALSALYYSHVEPQEITIITDYLKYSLRGNHWSAEERGKFSRERVTSLALESLLLVGEGYNEEPLASVVEWVVQRIESTDSMEDIAVLSIPLTYIAKGRAQEKTSYRRVEPVIFRETKVEQVLGHKVEGDYIEGDKVMGEKLGAGATSIRDSVVMRSKLGGSGGTADVRDSVVIKSDTDKVCYDVFTGERVSGVPCYCLRCGTKVENDWKCCPRCGYEMERVRKVFGEG